MPEKRESMFVRHDRLRKDAEDVYNLLKSKNLNISDAQEVLDFVKSWLDEAVEKAKLTTIN